ncbi:histone deacetylase [candidate division KSB1 bacterium]|nr:MAG: histone deacetylase [candidate division KSB1 bacterium]
MTGFVYHPDYLKHIPLFNHPENPERLNAIVSRLKETGQWEKLVHITPEPAEDKWIEEIHSRNYRKYVKDACKKGVTYLDGDTYISSDSYDIAVLAVGGVLSAVDGIMDDKMKNGFCAIRPPGHHAEKSAGMGFCIFNNVAIAARYIQKKYSLERIAIVDWDVHHGNGTQNSFYTDDSVLYVSLHQFPHYPGTGNKYETGAGKGEGFTLNFPMPAGSKDDDYLEIFREKLIPSLNNFEPQFILISAGFDAHQKDPLSGIFLSDSAYEEMTEMLLEVSEKKSQGRLLSVLEGGYNLNVLGNVISLHIQKLMEYD